MASNASHKVERHPLEEQKLIPPLITREIAVTKPADSIKKETFLKNSLPATTEGIVIHTPYQLVEANKPENMLRKRRNPLITSTVSDNWTKPKFVVSSKEPAFTKQCVSSQSNDKIESKLVPKEVPLVLKKAETAVKSPNNLTMKTEKVSCEKKDKLNLDLLAFIENKPGFVTLQEKQPAHLKQTAKVDSKVLAADTSTAITASKVSNKPTAVIIDSKVLVIPTAIVNTMSEQDVNTKVLPSVEVISETTLKSKSTLEQSAGRKKDKQLDIQKISSSIVKKIKSPNDSLLSLWSDNVSEKSASTKKFLLEPKEEKKDAVKDSKQITKATELSWLDLYVDYAVTDNRGGGNCMFHAILACFELDDIKLKYHALLRSLLADEIEKNWNDVYSKYAVDVQSGNLLDKKEYLRLIRKEATYGSELELCAFSKLFNCNIKVHIYRIEIKGKYKHKQHIFYQTQSFVEDESPTTIHLVLTQNAKDKAELSSHYLSAIPKHQTKQESKSLKSVTDAVKEALENQKKNDTIKLLDVKPKSRDYTKVKTIRGGRKEQDSFTEVIAYTSLGTYIPALKDTRIGKLPINDKAFILISELPQRPRGNSYGKDSRRQDLNDLKTKAIIFDVPIYKENMNKLYSIAEEETKEFPGVVICGACSNNARTENAVKCYTSYKTLLDHIYRDKEAHRDDCDKMVIEVGTILNYTEDMYGSHYNKCKNSYGTILQKKELNAGSSLPIQELSILAQNIRSIQNPWNRYELERYAHFHMPDLILLNEACRQKNHESIKPISGYNWIITEGTQPVAIMAKDCYKFTKVAENLSDDQHLFIKLRTISGNTLIIGCVYRSPKVKNKADFKRLKLRLQDLVKLYENPTVIIFGDLNADRPTINKYFKDSEFIIICDKNEAAYTRSRVLSDKVEYSYLDYFLGINIESWDLKILDSKTKSDHALLALKIQISNDTRCVKTYLEMLNLNEIKKEFNKNLEPLYQQLRSAATGKEMWEMLQAASLNLNKQLRIVKITRPSTFALLTTIEAKLLKQELTIEEVCSFLLRKKRNDYQIRMDEILELLQTNKSKEFWKSVNFFSKQQSKACPMTEVTDDTEVITDKEAVHSLCSAHFAKLFMDDKPNKSVYLNTDEPSLISFSKEEILTAIERLSINKALAWDLIGDAILPKLKSLLTSNNSQISLKTANFINLIEQQLEGNVTMARLFLLNKDSATIPKIEKLRPLGIISPLLKLVELLHRPELNRVMNLPGKQNQIGFKNKMGTEVNLKRYKLLTENRRRFYPEQTYSLFIDFSNAYCLVDHEILLKRLEANGTCTKTMTFIRKMYSKMHVKISQESSPIPINRGVIQGSCLSPALFNIYIDPLVMELNRNKYVTLAYADDLVTVGTEAQLLKAFEIIQRWSQENRLIINKSKCGILPLRKGNNTAITQHESFEGIPLVEEYTYLGVVMNQSGTIMNHLKSIDTKLKFYSDNLYKIRYLDPRAGVRLWQVLARPRITYGILILAGSKTEIKEIETRYFRSLKAFLFLSRKAENERMCFAASVPLPSNLKTIIEAKTMRKLYLQFQELCYRDQLKHTLASFNVRNIKELEQAVDLNHRQHFAKLFNCVVPSSDALHNMYKLLTGANGKGKRVLNWLVRNIWWKAAKTCKCCKATIDGALHMDDCPTISKAVIKFKTLTNAGTLPIATAINLALVAIAESKTCKANTLKSNSVKRQVNDILAVLFETNNIKPYVKPKGKLIVKCAKVDIGNE